MKEIGGYIELDTYNMPMLHEGAIALNCGRNALAYILRAKKIKKLLIPKFSCSSVSQVCEREDVKTRYYSIDAQFLPDNISLKDDEWLYVINYYGQLDNSMLSNLVSKYKRVIVDNAQAYFQVPLEHVDTLYTCRKFFGVADGSFVYTNALLEENFPVDESFERMHFLLGRYERSASEFYSEYVSNNDMFDNEPIKQMSKLTRNLLHGIDYDCVKKIRTDNFSLLHQQFNLINKLQLTIPNGAYMYPLYLKNGEEMRKKLQEKKIYIPTLWADVFKLCTETELEWDYAKNILPLPCDQRYGKEDMEYLIKEIKQCINYEN